MTVLHETPECDRQRNALRAERLARMKPKPKPVIVAIVASPAPPVIAAVAIEAASTEPTEAPYEQWSPVVDHGVKRRVRHGRVPSLMHIKTVVASQYHVSVLDMESARRTINVCWPRQIAQYLCAVMTLRSLPAIGRKFGDRDHTTILGARNKVIRVMTANHEFAQEIERLKGIILGVQLRSSTPPLTDGTHDAGTGRPPVPPPTNLPHNKTRSEHSGSSA